jgi:hypothetical protein
LVEKGGSIFGRIDLDGLRENRFGAQKVIIIHDSILWIALLPDNAYSRWKRAHRFEQDFKRVALTLVN